MNPILLVLLVLGVHLNANANPYPDPNAVPKDSPSFFKRQFNSATPLRDFTGTEVIRVDISWAAGEVYKVDQIKRELSGTEALARRAPHADPIGSFRGKIIDSASGEVLYQETIGTGTSFRQLTRALSFRFPFIHIPVRFELDAENPTSGKMEKVLSHSFFPDILLAPEAPKKPPTVKLLKAATSTPSLVMAVYAEGYLASKENAFWQDAARAVSALESNNFPGLASMEFRGVFQPSLKTLGAAKNLGTPIPEWGTFLGLYFPYWGDLERWYHIVYPTRESKFRDGIGQVAYDYPLVLIDDRAYWGVGNYRELTAVPSQNSSFTYLLLHEMGHFFGLNEEYEGGGKTELAFAPQIEEPWSQNITFLDGNSVKWSQFVDASTPLPTPASHWSAGHYGAYRGGYAQTPPYGKSHKPGLDCVMKDRKHFCAICKHAIEERIAFDLGGRS